jgi:hypothetical protein
MVPGVAATAAIGVALAQGALAASFSVSGQQFKVRVDQLDGTGFVQYGQLVEHINGVPRPVAVSAFDHAELTDLCQSVVIPVPGFGDVTVRITAGTDPDNPVVAENMFIDVAQLDADAVFSNIDIGIDASTADAGPRPVGEHLQGAFAQQADSVLLTDVEQTAWATSAATFRLTDLSLRLSRGTDAECF